MNDSIEVIKMPRLPRWRNPIPNPFPIPIPNPIPFPRIDVGGTLGEALGGIQNAIDNIDNFNYRNQFFDKLNEEAQNLIGEMEDFMAEAGVMSKEEAVSNLLNNIKPQLTADTNGEAFNELFKNEAVAFFNGHFASNPQTCYFVVAGLMIAAAVILIVVAPATTVLVDSLIAGAFTLAAAGCAVQ